MSDPFTLKLHPRGPPQQLCACFIHSSRPGFSEFVFSLKVTNSSFPLTSPSIGAESSERHNCPVSLRHAGKISDHPPSGIFFIAAPRPLASGLFPFALQRPRQRKTAVMSAADRRSGTSAGFKGFLLKNDAVAFGVLRESHLTFF